jgi:hypothetical protein
MKVPLVPSPSRLFRFEGAFRLTFVLLERRGGNILDSVNLCLASRETREQRFLLLPKLPSI